MDKRKTIENVTLAWDGPRGQLFKWDGDPHPEFGNHMWLVINRKKNITPGDRGRLVFNGSGAWKFEKYPEVERIEE